MSSVKVHAHARELGVVRLGPGPNALMRFDLAVVRERIAALVQAIRGYPDHRHDASVADSNQEEVYIPIEGSATLRAPDGYLDPISGSGPI